MARDADPAVDQRREMLGLTLQALAEALDLTFQQVQMKTEKTGSVPAGCSTSHKS
jgi:hypothetical protein